jgi:putative ABC transport system permease protein
MVDLARKILLYDRLRFAITLCGVGFAVALVLVQVGLFMGLLDNASVTIQNTDADLWITARATPNIDFTNTFPETCVHRIRSIDGVERADNLIVWFIRVALPSGAQEGVQVYAMENFERWGLPWKIVEGDLADLRRGRYVMIDDSATRRFGAFEVGEYREFLGTRMKIVGRTREALSFTTTPIAFMNHSTMQSIAPDLHNRTNYILVKLEPGADAGAVAAEIRRSLPYNDVHTRAQWASMSRRYWISSTGLGLNLFLTVFLGALVGVVIVAQTLYSSTMEHLKEFGTIKAIGATNLDIYRILARQATIAAIGGFGVGAAITLASRPLMLRLDLKLIMPAGFWAAVFAGTIIMCLAAAMVSFRKVARLDPAMVFRG